jgi:hypothetical protein
MSPFDSFDHLRLLLKHSPPHFTVLPHLIHSYNNPQFLLDSTNEVQFVRLLFDEFNTFTQVPQQFLYILTVIPEIGVVFVGDLCGLVECNAGQSGGYGAETSP